MHTLNQPTEKSIAKLREILVNSYDLDLPQREVEKLGKRLVTLYIAQHMVKPELLSEALSKPKENKALLSQIERYWREDERRALIEKEQLRLLDEKGK